MNIPGALLLFGGAAWSAWQFWRKRAGGYRLASMILLALGSVFPSILTGLQALGNSSGAALGEFLGALCLLAGLLISLDVFTVFRVPFTRIVLYERAAPTPAAKPNAAPQP
jgi:Ca2+/Na+ antiporter